MWRTLIATEKELAAVFRKDEWKRRQIALMGEGGALGGGDQPAPPEKKDGAFVTEKLTLQKMRATHVALEMRLAEQEDSMNFVRGLLDRGHKLELSKKHGKTWLSKMREAKAKRIVKKKDGKGVSTSALERRKEEGRRVREKMRSQKKQERQFRP